MGEVVWGVDFRKERREEIEKMAAELVSIALLGEPHERAIYESSLGYIDELKPA